MGGMRMRAAPDLEVVHRAYGFVVAPFVAAGDVTRLIYVLAG